LAWASVQALCPSAASGLMVTPGGRLTVTFLSCEGVGFLPSGCGTLKVRSSPEAESASPVVRFAERTGLKLAFSQLSTGGYSDFAVDQVPGDW
jgi:hypothetical protein